MRVRIQRATIVDGKQVFPGEVVEVDEALALLLLRTRKAERVGEGASQQVSETATAEPPERAVKPRARQRRHD